jgi:hypothetical protein
MKTIYRVRSIKNRNGISNGPVFMGFHMGKRSFYIQKLNATRKMNVSISDKWGNSVVSAR